MPEHRPRGRPSLSGPGGGRSKTVHLNVPPRVYDRLCHVAHRLDISVPEVVRRRLNRMLRQEAAAAAAGEIDAQPDADGDST